MSEFDMDDTEELLEHAKGRIDSWLKAYLPKTVGKLMKQDDGFAEDLSDVDKLIKSVADERFEIVGKLIKSLADGVIELARRQGIEASLCDADVKALKVLGVET